MVASAVPLLEVNAEKPWLGLQSFGEGTEAYFFGRSREQQDLFERVEHRGLTVLYGQSGRGKSSLLRAGLLPRLRAAGSLPIVARLSYEESSPSPEAQLIQALSGALGRPLPEGVPLWLLAHDPVYGLCSPAGLQNGPGPVIVLDQFEEIFTLGERRPGAAAALRDALASLVENRVPPELDTLLATDDALAVRLRYEAQPVRVVLSLREDFLHLLERWKHAVPAVMENRLELPPLSGPQALEAVLGPGRLRCALDPSLRPIVDEATGAAIVRFVAGVAADVPLARIDAVPPLLSLLCTELNAQRSGLGGTISAEQLGGKVEDILQGFYDRTLEGLPPGVRLFVEDMLLTPFKGFRENISYEAAKRGLMVRAVPRPDETLAQLIDARLLVSEERGGLRRVELTHDILTGVVRRSRDTRRAQEKLERRTQEVRVARRRTALMGGVTLLALGAGVSGLYGWVQAQRARKETAHAHENEQRANQATSNADLMAAIRLLEDPAQRDRRAISMAMLVRSLQTNPGNFAAQARLYNTVINEPWLWVDRTLQKEVGLFQPLPGNEGRFLGVKDSLALYLFNSEVPESVGHTFASPITLFAVSPAGDRAAVVLGRTQWQIIELPTLRPLSPLLKSEAEIRSCAISPDSRQIALGGLDGSTHLHDVSTGRLLGEVGRHHGSVNLVNFSPSGARLLTAADDHTLCLWETADFQPACPPLAFREKVAGATFKSEETIAAYDIDGTYLCQLKNGICERETTFEVSGELIGLVETEREGTSQAIYLNTPSRHRVIFQQGSHTISLALPDRLRCLAFHPRGTAAAIGCQDGSLSVVRLDFEHESAAISATAYADQESATWVGFTKQGERILALTKNGDFRRYAYSLEPARPIAIRDPETRYSFAEFTPDSQQLILVAQKAARVVNLDGSMASPKLLSTSTITNFALSPVGAIFCTANLEGAVQISHWPSGEPGPSLPHPRRLWSLAFSSDGKLLASGAEDGVVRVWDPRNGHLVHQTQPDGEAVLSLAFSPSRDQLAAGKANNQVHVLSTRSWQVQARLPVPDDPKSLAFSPDGGRLAAGCDDGTARMWRAATFEIIATYNHLSPVRKVEWRNREDLLTICGDQRIRIWLPGTGSLGRSEPALGGFSQGILPWDPPRSFAGGEYFSSISTPSTVTLSQVSSRLSITGQRAFPEEIDASSVSPDLTHLAAVGNNSVFLTRIAPPPDFKLIEHLGDYTRLAGLRVDAGGQFRTIYEPISGGNSLNDWLLSPTPRAPEPFLTASPVTHDEPAGQQPAASAATASSIRYFALRSFSGIYAGEPLPGSRLWRKVKEDQWTEAYENGFEDPRKLVDAHAEVGGQPGIIVSPPNEPDFQIFIPHAGGEWMWLRFRRPPNPWNWLMAIKDLETETQPIAP